ncbi:hypothetical protein GN958_ATG01449 [Phytophthora infestans]|uniref:Uncharacterized protein n=1 Tax=Phytophthora infestans TaxID=4787 RepID=A0A8S9VDV4_PHYIN|nr:hypothetical protein GN958_ATG01449 [Phytophthora infestans]
MWLGIPRPKIHLVGRPLEALLELQAIFNERVRNQRPDRKRGSPVASVNSLCFRLSVSVELDLPPPSPGRGYQRATTAAAASTPQTHASHALAILPSALTDTTTLIAFAEPQKLIDAIHRLVGTTYLLHAARGHLAVLWLGSAG